MVGAIVFLARLVAGLLALFAVWFVLDNIHDRNTEIIVSTIGLMYAFIFMISRRLRYIGLTISSFFGRTASYIGAAPYGQVPKDEDGLGATSRHLYLNVVFAALIEILCLFRLFRSLTGRW
jgi:hypothetical protein